MTSAFLKQKLSRVKLRKSEFREIRILRTKNSQERSQAIKELKNILKQQDSWKTCRLCLKAGSKALFAKDQDNDYLSNIKDILGIEISENDGKPQHICSSCESTLQATVQLKQTAEITQWRLQQELEMVSVLKDNKNSGHLVDEGAVIVRKWKCRKCHKRFQIQEEFLAHEKLGSCCKPGLRRQRCICEICGLELKTLQTLKVHRIKHTGLLRHECSYCDYRAATKHHIKIHERCHTGSRPATCSECGASFQNTSNLNTHRRVHLPPQFRCHLCNFISKFKSSLKNHIEAHHGTEKPHDCNICGMAFTTRSHVLHHERRVHKRPRMNPSYKTMAKNDLSPK